MTGQAAAALARANEVRHARAEVKEAVASGDLDAAEVLATNAPDLQGMRVIALLQAVHRLGPNKVREMLSVRGCNASTFVTIGDLTARQRSWLLMALAKHRRQHPKSAS